MLGKFAHRRSDFNSRPRVGGDATLRKIKTAIEISIPAPA